MRKINEKVLLTIINILNFSLEDISKTRNKIRTLIRNLRNILKKVISNEVILTMHIYLANLNQGSMYLLTDTAKQLNMLQLL